MIQPKLLYEAFSKLKQTGSLGDFAVLKANAFGARINPAVKDKIQNVINFYPCIDLEELIQLPQDTFGYTYARHMQENHLHPFNISSELSEAAKENTFALRYAVTHDIFHVLLGFDTSYAGEIGVLAFAAEQKYSNALKISLLFAYCIYPLLAPFQTREIFVNARQGKQMAQRAKFLLGYRFEDHWEEPLAQVKADLGLS